MLNRSRHRRHLHGLLVLYGRPKASRGRLRPRQLPDRLLRGVLRAHFKTWYDRCGVSVKRTVSYVGFLQFGSALVSLRYPNVGFEMRSKDTRDEDHAASSPIVQVFFAHWHSHLGLSSRLQATPS